MLIFGQLPASQRAACSGPAVHQGMRCSDTSSSQAALGLCRQKLRHASTSVIVTFLPYSAFPRPQCPTKPGEKVLSVSLVAALRPPAPDAAALGTDGAEPGRWPPQAGERTVHTLAWPGDAA